MKRRHLYLFICTFSIMGCVEGLMEYKLSYDGDKIVIVGMLSDKGEGKILIRKSLHPQNPEGNDTLYNATVEMYENGNQYTSLVESGTGNFFLPEGVTLVPGNYYHLVANGGNLPRAETTPQLLYPPVCFDTAYFETRYAKYCFTDPADTTNYYTVMMREFFLGEDITDYEHRMEFINPYGLFTDAKYNEDICYYNDINKLIERDRDSPNYGLQATDSAVLKLFNLSEGIYLYSESVQDYEFTRGDPLFDLTPIYTNVNGGFGVFGVYSTCEYGFRINM